MALLTVAGLSKSFGGVQAVHEVSFSLQSGVLLALIGPNGAGKSTCFNMLNGQLRPDAGTILLGVASIAILTWMAPMLGRLELVWRAVCLVPAIVFLATVGYRASPLGGARA